MSMDIEDATRFLVIAFCVFGVPFLIAVWARRRRK
jgi:hypothetical protein